MTELLGTPNRKRTSYRLEHYDTDVSWWPLFKFLPQGYTVEEWFVLLPYS